MGKKLWFFIIPFVITAAMPQGCSHGLNIKIYYSRPDLDGVYRKQDDELIRYQDTEGYRCLNPSDWEAVLNYVKACQVE